MTLITIGTHVLNLDTLAFVRFGFAVESSETGRRHAPLFTAQATFGPAESPALGVTGALAEALAVRLQAHGVVLDLPALEAARAACQATCDELTRAALQARAGADLRF